jgi:RIO kinase 2
VYFGCLSQDGSDVPDCNLASRDSDAPGTFSEEVSHLSIRLNKQTFDGIFLHFFTTQHGTSYSGENRLETPPSGGNGVVMTPLESGIKMLSLEDDDNDDDSSEDADEEEDAELTKQLNKQRKKAWVEKVSFIQERLQGQG